MTEASRYPAALDPLLCKWSRTYVNLAPVETLPEVGIELLSSGFDTPEILCLAVCDRFDHPDDIRRAAKRAFASLGFRPENVDFHEIVIGRSIARQIVDYSLSPEEGLAQMFHLWRRRYYSDFCHFVFEEWMLLNEAIYLFREGYGGLELFHDLTEETFPDTVIKLAGKFLAEHPVPYHP